MRFGIIRDRESLMDWQSRCLDELLRIRDMELALVITNIVSRDQEGPLHNRRFADLISGRATLWNLYDQFYLKPRTRSCRLVLSHPAVLKAPQMACRLRSSSTEPLLYDPQDVDTIRLSNLDFLLFLGSDDFSGDILDAARHGVWAFRFGEPASRLSEPPCFWELYHRESTICVSLQRLSERAEDNVVLCKGVYAATGQSLAQTRDTAYYASVGLPVKACNAIRSNDQASRVRGPMSPPRSRQADPTHIQFLRFFAGTIQARLRDKLEWFFRHSQWGVGFVHRPIQDFLTLSTRPNVNWIPNSSRTRFLADPSGLLQDDGLTVLLEEYDYTKRIGFISCLTIRDNGAVDRPREVMRFPVHSSYPYLFRYAGQIFMVPETSRAREVVLYKATKFPEEWIREATLLTDFPALDATLFEYENRWWLFCARLLYEGAYGLYAWHAPSPYGPWSPHADNPLTTDIRSSRPGGSPFWHEGRLYRPAQDCSRTYGGALAINRVDVLTPETFREEVVTVIQPDPGSAYPAGFHTLFEAGDYTLVDGKRMVLIPRMFRNAVLETLSKFRLTGRKR